MKKIIGYLSFTALILACGKDRIVDITPLVDLSSGIIIDIPFDSNTLELNTNQTGLNTKATYCPNRKNIANLNSINKSKLIGWLSALHI
jgi:hypothetical protein